MIQDLSLLAPTTCAPGNDYGPAVGCRFLFEGQSLQAAYQAAAPRDHVTALGAIDHPRPLDAVLGSDSVRDCCHNGRLLQSLREHFRNRHSVFAGPGDPRSGLWDGELRAGFRGRFLDPFCFFPKSVAADQFILGPETFVIVRKPRKTPCSKETFGCNSEATVPSKQTMHAGGQPHGRYTHVEEIDELQGSWCFLDAGCHWSTSPSASSRLFLESRSSPSAKQTDVCGIKEPSLAISSITVTQGHSITSAPIVHLHQRPTNGHATIDICWQSFV
jgi:hypothetical protein